MPPVPSSGAVVALNEGDSDAEEIFDDSLASSKVESAREGQHGAGLQALLAYLKDLDDLAPRSGGPLGPALARPGGFRREKTPRSFVSSAHEGYQADTDTTKATQASFDSPADSPQLPIFKLKEDLAKRESVLNEIVATERSYVMGLQELVEVYVKPSSRPAKPTSSGVGSSSSRDTIIPTAERKAVFSNVENLLQFHESAFLPDLESVLARLSGNQRESDASGTEQHSALLTSTAEEIAKVFVRHGAFLRMYHM